ncbi:MAG: RagB/SusD family nutrient uptake outer membrane protein, partial [Sediminibacterium sp.]|nr:RagB/SusD family nutrient uptake outer membrane protein [Sediminibacterium sp.]
TLFLFFVIFIGLSCKKELDVKNPNDPNISLNVVDEGGLAKYATGVVYFDGFNDGVDWLGDSYFSLPRGYGEIMAEVLHGGAGSNNQVNTIGAPDKIILSPGGTTLTNPSPQIKIIRDFNNRAATSQGNNALYYQWLAMYALNYGCNSVLEIVDNISFTGDKLSKQNTVKAWCNWWKGYAYAQIGTLYYAGLINNSTKSKSNKFVSYKDMIAESNKFYNAALANLNAITSEADYNSLIKLIIPSVCQVGKGLPPTKDMWIRNINTMLARNIILNKISPFVNGVSGGTIQKSVMDPITTADWTAIKNYCTNGIKSTDYVFTGRAPSTNYFFSPQSGSCNANATGSVSSTTLKISERITQDFNLGDKRYINNFDTAVSRPTYAGSGINANTTQSLLDGGRNIAGVVFYGSQTALELELYIAGTYEENELMLAEANINLGSIPDGITSLNNVKNFQGAGLQLSGSFTKNQALAELTKERRVALMFRGLSFYDMRRWGWSYSIANGGGRYGCVAYDGSTKYTNATFDYNYMDYWDVPGDELELNAPGTGSFAVKNPNY